MAIPFGLHSELNIPIDTLDVVNELRQLAWTIRPGGESATP